MPGAMYTRTVLEKSTIQKSKHHQKNGDELRNAHRWGTHNRLQRSFFHPVKIDRHRRSAGKRWEKQHGHSCTGTCGQRGQRISSKFMGGGVGKEISLRIIFFVIGLSPRLCTTIRWYGWKDQSVISHAHIQQLTQATPTRQTSHPSPPLIPPWAFFFPIDLEFSEFRFLKAFTKQVNKELGSTDPKMMREILIVLYCFLWRFRAMYLIGGSEQLRINATPASQPQKSFDFLFGRLHFNVDYLSIIQSACANSRVTLFFLFLLTSQQGSAYLETMWSIEYLCGIPELISSRAISFTRRPGRTTVSIL